MTAGHTPDMIDLRVLEILQDDIPINSRPWRDIAARLGLTEEEVMVRIQRLQDSRIVLGISPTLESRTMGLHAATLVALRVPEERVHDIASVISRYPEVSHNYRRDHEYSIWFTLSAPTFEKLNKTLVEIREKTGIQDKDILNLPTIQKLKIDLRFSFSHLDEQEAETHGQH